MRSNQILIRWRRSFTLCKNLHLVWQIISLNYLVLVGLFQQMKHFPLISKNQLQVHQVQHLRHTMQIKSFKGVWKLLRRSVANFRAGSKSAIKWVKSSSTWNKPSTIFKEIRTLWSRLLNRQAWARLHSISAGSRRFIQLSRDSLVPVMAGQKNSKIAISHLVVTMLLEMGLLLEVLPSTCKTSSTRLPTRNLHTAKISSLVLDWHSNREAPQTNRSISTVDRTRTALALLSAASNSSLMLTIDFILMK